MAVLPSRCFGISHLGFGRETLRRVEVECQVLNKTVLRPLVMMQNHLVTGKNMFHRL